MATGLGKRKRDAVLTRRSQQPEKRRVDALDEDEAARALFRRAFESKFQALDKPPVETQQRAERDEDDNEDEQEGDADDYDHDTSKSLDSEWSGISDGQDRAEAVEVVDHGRTEATDANRKELDKIHRKAFMSSRPPWSETKQSATKSVKTTSGDAEDEDMAEKANLKNDLALQRLLKESHLLDPTSATQSSSFTVEGKGRLKALDMRIQDLGAKSSALAQEKMPMAQRKGILEKRAQRETARRKEAAANGVILEKARAKIKVQKRRERGIGGPSIGKFQRGALKLSSRDVRNIVAKGSAGGRERRR